MQFVLILSLFGLPSTRTEISVTIGSLGKGTLSRAGRTHASSRAAFRAPRDDRFFIS